jgi:hypothetical protein
MLIQDANAASLTPWGLIEFALRQKAQSKLGIGLHKPGSGMPFTGF